MNFLTLPISEVHDTTIVLGTVVESRTREVMLMGRLGLFGSTPFLVGGRYPCRQNIKHQWLWFSVTENMTWQTNDKSSGLTGRLQGFPFTFTHRLGGKWSSWGQLVSDKQNLKNEDNRKHVITSNVVELNVKSNLFLLSCHYHKKVALLAYFTSSVV